MSSGPVPDRPAEGSDPAALLWAMSDLQTPWALRAAVGLRLAEHLVEGAQTVDRLVERTGCDRHGLVALLGLLVRRGVLHLDGEEYSLSALGALLHPDHPQSRRDALDPAGIRTHLDTAFAGLAEALSPRGAVAYAAVHGRGFWESLEADGELAERFDRHLAASAARWSGRAAHDHVWHDVTTVIDLGGGLGTLAAALVEGHSHLHVTVLERPDTACRARAELAATGTDRVEVIAGDFFRSVPQGADCYVLSQVLHDWDDEHAVDLLRVVARRAGSGARVVVIERLESPEVSTGFAQMSLLMFALFGAHERTRAELGALAERAGIDMAVPRRLDGDLWLCEGRVR